MDGLLCKRCNRFMGVHKIEEECVIWECPNCGQTCEDHANTPEEGALDSSYKWKPPLDS